MNDSLPPTTADYLEFHAAHRPAAVALVIGRKRVTYGDFHRDLGRFTRVMRRLELPRGAAVAVSCPLPYIHWLLLLACENLGLVTGSFVIQEGSAAADLLGYVDLVMAERRIDGVPVRRFLPITQEWIASALAEPDAPPAGEPDRVRLALDAPQRIRRSSGTTGGKKMMISARRVEEQLIRVYLDTVGFTPASRFIVCHAFSAGAVYARATTCLRLGAMCAANLSWPAVSALGGTHIWLQPILLEQALDALPAGFARMDGLAIETAGSALPKALRERALSRFAGEITNAYGGNEVGPVCAFGPDGTGLVLPGVELEVVDDDDRPVPAGQVGVIRVRTSSMVDGYVGNPEATARLFRGGWFHSGDAGRLVGERRLALLGRRDEVVNIGGLKNDPGVFEQDLRKVPGVADAAVVALGGPEGTTALGIAIVLASQARPDEVAASIQRFAAPWGVALRLRTVDQVPRTDTGKIQRYLVSRLFVTERSDAQA